jgi:hypothetical protein
MGGSFATLLSGEDGAEGTWCSFCGAADGPLLEVDGLFGLRLCAACQADRRARRSAQLLGDHDRQRLWWQWGCPLCDYRAGAPWDLEVHTTRRHPGWSARFELVRLSPRPLLRVAYHRWDTPGADTRLNMPGPDGHRRAAWVVSAGADGGPARRNGLAQMAD